MKQRLTYQLKINKLAKLCTLNSWEDSFIHDISFGIDGTGTLHDESIREYLTDKQIEKLQEIWVKYKDKGEI